MKFRMGMNVRSHQYMNEVVADECRRPGCREADNLPKAVNAERAIMREHRN